MEASQNLMTKLITILMGLGWNLDGTERTAECEEKEEEEECNYYTTTRAAGWFVGNQNRIRTSEWLES